MHPALAPLAATLRLNTRLLRNALDGMGDRQAWRRAAHDCTTAGFIALHLVDSRHFLAKSLGQPAENPFTELLEVAKGQDDLAAQPSVEEILGAWDAVSGHLDTVLAALTAERLERPAPQRFPIVDKTVLAEIAFLVQHDSYHIGQVALLRRQLGLPAMKYR